MLIVGVLLLVMFGFWERTYPYPLMPPHIWNDGISLLYAWPSLLIALPGLLTV